MPRDLITVTKTYTHFHMCCGLGGGKAGFNAAKVQVGSMAATFRCIGGVDVDPAAIRDFDRAGPGRPGTVMDLFTRAQYNAFHGKEPPAGWREATAVDIRRAAGNECPNIVFISSPCKGASGLLSESLSKTAKYQALNELTLRCIWLMCEAWADNPPELLIFENVPRLKSRGKHLLDQITQLLQQFGYATAVSDHDCGELGGLAQHRKRLLLVARHNEKVPPFLYEPEKKQLRAVGDVLGRMPFPGDPAGGPMHRIPRLQWKTWVRLAFVEPGSDWRSLNRLAIKDGQLADYLIMPERRNDFLGMNAWDQPCGAVSSRGTPTTGAYSVADPRHFGPAKHSNEMRISEWEQPARVVSSAHSTGQCVADPRLNTKAEYSQYGVMGWGDTSGTITSQSAPGGGVFSVADPRTEPAFLYQKYAIIRRDEHTDASGMDEEHGPRVVEDPRTIHRDKGDAFLTGGHYGVVRWDGHSGAVSAAAGHDNGRWSVADPRIDLAPALPAANENTVAMIRTPAGDWHRPMTTLELAALQSLIDPDEFWSTDPQTQREIDAYNASIGRSLCLDGTNDSAHRERIGNAVPPKAARAIAEAMGTTLLLAEAGETFVLSALPVWVQPIAIAIAAGSSHLHTA